MPASPLRLNQILEGHLLPTKLLPVNLKVISATLQLQLSGQDPSFFIRLPERRQQATNQRTDASSSEEKKTENTIRSGSTVPMTKYRTLNVRTLNDMD